MKEGWVKEQRITELFGEVHIFQKVSFTYLNCLSQYSPKHTHQPNKTHQEKPMVFIYFLQKVDVPKEPMFLNKCPINCDEWNVGEFSSKFHMLGEFVTNARAWHLCHCVGDFQSLGGLHANPFSLISFSPSTTAWLLSQEDMLWVRRTIPRSSAI